MKQTLQTTAAAINQSSSPIRYGRLGDPDKYEVQRGTAIANTHGLFFLLQGSLAKVRFNHCTHILLDGDDQCLA